MKIFSFPYNASHLYNASPFYAKPDTALALPTQDFYLPPVCGGLQYAVCYAIKVNRLGRHIEERFAHRYFSETTVGLCLYGLPPVEETAPAWDPGRLMDYSLPLPRTFLPLEQLPAQVVLRQSTPPPGEVAVERTLTLPQPPQVWCALARLSRFVYVKMGDILLLELHEPLPAAIGHTLCVEGFACVAIK